MTNEEKAKEIAYKCFPDTFEHETFGCPNCEAGKAESACLEMAKWKEEQVIEKACKWLRKHKDSYAVCDIRTDKMSVANKLVSDFKKAMMEE